MRPDFSRNPREIAKSSRSAIYTYRFQLLVVNSIGTLLAQRLQRSAAGDDLIEHGEVIAPSFLTSTSFGRQNSRCDDHRDEHGKWPNARDHYRRRWKLPVQSAAAGCLQREI